MGTNVHYNGIELHNCLTRQFDQEIVYDASGTDQILTRFKLAFECILTVPPYEVGYQDTLQWLDREDARTPSRERPVAVEQFIRQQLTQPRRPLKVVLELGDYTDTLLEVRPVGIPGTPGAYMRTGASPEVDNGPKPQMVSILTIVANKTFRVRFVVDCAVVECGIGRTAPPFVLNNRWSVEERMDENFYTTRSIRGRIRLSNAEASPHVYKGLIIPGLERGFKRESVSFTAAENGLEATYEITDKQTYNSAPWPATSIDGRASTSTGDGMSFYSDVQIRLTGSPEASRAKLVDQAIYCADARLNFFLSQKAWGTDYTLEGFSIAESLGEDNWVEVACKIQHVPVKNTGGEIVSNIPKDTLALPLRAKNIDGHGYDPRMHRLAPVYGYDPHMAARSGAAALFMLHCVLQEPCRPVATKAIGKQTTAVAPAYEPDTGQTEVSGSIVNGSLPGEAEADLWDPNVAAEGLVTHYVLETRYINEPLVIGLPIAHEDPDSKACAVFAKLGPGVGRREIQLQAERVGTWPKIPEAKEKVKFGEVHGRLVKHWTKMQPPRPSVNGRQPVHRVEAFYAYALDRIPKATDKRPVGMLPFAQIPDDGVAANDLQDSALGV